MGLHFGKSGVNLFVGYVVTQAGQALHLPIDQTESIAANIPIYKGMNFSEAGVGLSKLKKRGNLTYVTE